jgi:hypothetical protein
MDGETHCARRVLSNSHDPKWQAVTCLPPQVHWLCYVAAALLLLPGCPLLILRSLGLLLTPFLAIAAS